MAQDTFSLAITGTKTIQKGALVKDILDVAEADYKRVLRGIAIEQIDLQRALGNEPTHLIIDGRDSGTIATANYSVRAFFVDAASMVKALDDVWREVHRLARHRSGYSASRFEVWKQEGRGAPHKAGDSPGAINAKSLDISTALYVVGPMVPHVRKFQWYFGSPSLQRYRRSKAQRYKNLKAKDKPRVAYSIQQQAARAIKPKYTWLGIKDAWVNSPNQNPKGKEPITRVPAVWIFSRNRGVLH